MAVGPRDGYRKVIGPAGHAGLVAEVAFYERFRQDYKLVVGLDAADHTDFSAFIEGAPHRIDVTTNLAFKKLGDYEPLQSEGDRYKIAVFDGADFELFDINYPFCPDCGDGRVLPTGMLLGVNMDADGNSEWSNDQLLVKICSACGEIEVAERITPSELTELLGVAIKLHDRALEQDKASNWWIRPSWNHYAPLYWQSRDQRRGSLRARWQAVHVCPAHARSRAPLLDHHMANEEERLGKKDLVGRDLQQMEVIQIDNQTFLRTEKRREVPSHSAPSILRWGASVLWRSPLGVGCSRSTPARKATLAAGWDQAPIPAIPKGGSGWRAAVRSKPSGDYP